MSAESYSSASDRPRWRGILLALVVEGLIALLLLQLGTGVFLKQPKQPALTTFDVRPVGPPVSKQAQRTQAASKKHQVHAASAAAPPAPVAPPPVKAPPAKLIQLSPDDFASSDIGRIPSHKGDGDGDGEGSGHDSVAAYGPGQGPGGGALYNAEWYREPRDAELDPYLKDYAKGTGWALIACKTAPDFRVENCRSIDESPPGGGLSRALRLAAWQFRVRPPRVGGKSLVGAWVRIKFDLTVGFTK